MNTGPRLAGVELGGTKSIAVLADGHDIVESVSFPTQAPETTLAALHGQLRQWHDAAPLAGLGIASFGPLQLDAAAPGYGRMLDTPKPGWSGADIAQGVVGDLPCPWRLDTDVNGAALAEYLWGAGQQCDSVCYVTIGTGVGGGLVLGGKAVHGAMHPEIGHLRLRRAHGDMFAGACPFHGDCVEGLLSGPALAARFGMDGALIAEDHPGWADVAADLAELVGALLLVNSCQRVLFGGSVALHRAFLLPQVRRLAVERYGSYLPFLNHDTADRMIRLAELGPQAGPLGSIALVWPG